MSSRRQFIKLTTGAVAVGYALTGCGLLRDIANQRFVSPCTDDDGQHYVGACDIHGRLNGLVALPQRAHGLVSHPHHKAQVFVFARRPGRSIWQLDMDTEEIVQHVNCLDDFHLYGHGDTTANGQQLVTTEQHYPSGAGKLVVRDIESLAVSAIYESGGIGPHECKMMPDGDHVVIANGGILTHPSTGRAKLNIDTMQPNLTLLNLHSGEIVMQHPLGDPLLSIRHLDVSADGKVIVGLQYQGRGSVVVPLIASFTMKHGLQYVSAGDSIWRSLNHYTGSVAINHETHQVAVSSPKGDTVTYWCTDTMQYLGKTKSRDVCGVVADAGHGFVATSGIGSYLSQLPSRADKKKHHGLHWDNHMVRL